MAPLRAPVVPAAGTVTVAARDRGPVAAEAAASAVGPAAFTPGPFAAFAGPDRHQPAERHPRADRSAPYGSA